MDPGWRGLRYKAVLEPSILGKVHPDRPDNVLVQSEWYDFGGDEFEESFIEDFIAFDDDDINRNSIDFIYFMNSSGMSEYTLEFSQRNVSKARFQRGESVNHGGR